MTQEATKRAFAAEAESPEVSFREQVALLAYQLWEQRGCPEGSSEEDWLQAEQELMASR